MTAEKIHAGIAVAMKQFADAEGRQTAPHSGASIGFEELRLCGNRRLNGKIEGTPRYMAPECFQGWPADRRTDIFSLGVVLEEMAAGRSMPESFHALIARATARERAQRFPSMEDLASALHRIEEAPEAPSIERAHALISRYAQIGSK